MLTKIQIDTLKRARTGARNRVAKAMELADVNQVELANLTGHTQSYVSRVLNGRYSALPGETMRTFAAAFGCSIEDLFPAGERSAVAS